MLAAASPGRESGILVEPDARTKHYAAAMDEGTFLAHYESGVERDRLAQGTSRIEFERTKELLLRHLPPPPATVLDVGGGPGAYAAWLSALGYEVHLVDPVPLHIEQATAAARRSPRPFTAVLGDARRLAEPDASRDVVLVFGPLYHLTERADRVRSLSEARRVVRPGGLVAAAAISRFASLLDGLRNAYLSDPAFREIVRRDLAEGQHRNRDGRLEWFTPAYFHHPEELPIEFSEAGLEIDAVFGVEGPGWLLADPWDDPNIRAQVLFAARAAEREPALLAVSAHLLAIGHRPDS
jgi:ubiquinone/menaquinone biosynthesis C-methylase UbiE